MAERLEIVEPDVFRWTSNEAWRFTERAIYFDMDGTIADLYGVPNWLPRLEDEDPTPYFEAEPLVDTELLWDLCATANAAGYRIGIISWLSKYASYDYSQKIIDAKLDWCDEFLPEVDEIVLAPYGVPKSTVAEIRQNAILIDDEKPNRLEWTNPDSNCLAYSTHDMEAVLELLEAMMTDEGWYNF